MTSTLLFSICSPLSLHCANYIIFSEDDSVANIADGELKLVMSKNSVNEGPPKGNRAVILKKNASTLAPLEDASLNHNGTSSSTCDSLIMII